MSWKEELRERVRKAVGPEAILEGLRRDNEDLMQFLVELFRGTGVAVSLKHASDRPGDPPWSALSLSLSPWKECVEVRPRVETSGKEPCLFVIVSCTWEEKIRVRILRVDQGAGMHRWALCPSVPGEQLKEFGYRDLGEFIERLLTGRVEVGK
jgi:hypothetical protein